MYAIDLLDKSTEVKKEKIKSDNLVYQLLPRSVAHYLKQSKQVKRLHTPAGLTSTTCLLVYFYEVGIV